MQSISSKLKAQSPKLSTQLEVPLKGFFLLTINFKKMDLLDQDKQPEVATPEEEAAIPEEIRSEHYEICYIISSTFTQEETTPIVSKVEDLLKQHQAQITKKEDMGKLKFAYPIKHQSHGYYQVVEFDLPKKELKSLQESLLLANELLRFLITKKKMKTDKELAQEKAFQEKLARKKGAEIEKIKAEKEESKEKPKKSKADKVSLEDLDKKLDEILDTDSIV